MAPIVYQDQGQWIGSKLWYWKNSGEPDAQAHGPFPWKWLATLAARLGGGR